MDKCIYCREENAIKNDMGYDVQVWMIDCKNKQIILHSDNLGIFSWDVRFCPMCGSKL